MDDALAGIEESVAEATSRKTFSIVDAIRNRAYPKSKVEVYLDEQAAFDAAEIFEELEASRINDGDGVDSDETIALEKKFSEKLQEVDSSKMIFLVSGISEGDREKILEEVEETIPTRYEETRSPITGVVTKQEIPDRERDRLATLLLWRAHIRSVTTPDGAVQDEFTLDEIAELRNALPLAAVAAIAETIEKVRVATAVFMSKVNEDFLAKR